MRKYKVSPAVNMNKIFLVKSSELESRLDPHFYKPEFRILQNKLVSKPHSKLGNLIYFSDETWNQKDFFDERFPYIEISSIDTSTGEIEYVDNISKSEAPSRAKKIVREDDIIVSTTRPNRGAISLIKKDYDFHIVSTGFSVLRNQKTDLITKEFLYVILRQPAILKQMEQRSSGGNYPAITEDELRKILIPILDAKKRNTIIKILQNAFLQKQHKEQKAKAQLDSIDDYLLTELDIQINKKDSSLKSRIFKAKYSNVSGKRLDPLFYHHNILESIPLGKYESSILRNYIEYAVSGFAAGKYEQTINDDDIIQIRPTNINDSRELVFDKNIYISKNKLPQHKKDVLQKDEVLFNNTNSQELVGKSTYFNLDNIYFCSNHITRIKTSANLDSKFLTAILNLYQRNKVFYRLATNWNNQSGINNYVLNRLIIPLPPIENQRKISSEIFSRINEAKQLNYEANLELEKARKKVEKIILEE